MLKTRLKNLFSPFGYLTRRQFLVRSIVVWIIFAVLFNQNLQYVAEWLVRLGTGIWRFFAGPEYYSFLSGREILLILILLAIWAMLILTLLYCHTAWIARRLRDAGNSPFWALAVVPFYAFFIYWFGVELVEGHFDNKQCLDKLMELFSLYAFLAVNLIFSLAMLLPRSLNLLSRF